MLAEFDNFRSVQSDAGKYRNGVEQDRNRGSVRNGAVMLNVGFRAIDRLVVIGRFDKCELVAESRGALGLGDGLGRGFRSCAGNQEFFGARGFPCGDQDGIGFLAGKHDRFAG